MELLVVDYIVILALLVSATLSLIRGFTREILSIVNWVVAIYAALFFAPLVRPLLAEYIAIEAVVNIGAMVIVFLVVFIAASMITSAIADRFKKHTPGVLDHTMGIVFGLSRGALIVCLAYLGLVLAIPENEHPEWVRDAKTRPLMQTGVQIIVATVPLDRLPVNLSNIEGLLLPNPSGIPKAIEKLPKNIKDKLDETGYKDKQRKQIERLIRNTQ